MNVSRMRTLAVVTLSSILVAPAYAQRAVSLDRATPTAATPATPGTLLSLRLASDDALPGFEAHYIGSRVYYISPTPYLSSQDIVSVETSTDARAGRVVIELSEAALERRLDQTRGRLAIFANGHLVAVPMTQRKGRAGALNLVGMLPGQAQRVGRLLTAAPTAPAGPQISLRASESTISPGDEVFIEVFLESADDVRGVQFALEASGGIAGHLSIEEISIDGQREDYLFGAAQTVVSTDVHRGRILAARYNGGVSVTEGAYVGTFRMIASDDARGTFQVSVKSDQSTLLRDSDGLPISYRTTNPTPIVVGLASTTAIRR
jgi:hypothetical protein